MTADALRVGSCARQFVLSFRRSCGWTVSRDAARATGNTPSAA